MPAHNHSGSTNLAGEHTHLYGGAYFGADAYNRRDAYCPSDIDILPMPKCRGFLDTNDTCLLK